MYKILLALACLLAVSLAAVPVPDEAKTVLVNLHNKERKEVGNPPIKWSDKLAADAAGAADQCHGHHTSFGENIYASSSTTMSVKEAFEKACKSWASEKSRKDPPKFDCIKEKSEHTTCGHWSQMVWKASTEVGCALSRCSNLQYKTQVYCRYKPEGNMGMATWDMDKKDHVRDENGNIIYSYHVYDL